MVSQKWYWVPRNVVSMDHIVNSSPKGFVQRGALQIALSHPPKCAGSRGRQTNPGERGGGSRVGRVIEGYRRHWPPMEPNW